MTDTSPVSLALIGCGLMGHGIAKNLLKAGHALAVFDHPGNQPMDDLRAAGATVCADMGDLLEGREAVFLVLPGSPEVDAVVNGPDGLLAHLQAGQLVIDATSAEPGETVKIAAAVQSAGAAYVDAPMTRTPKEAEEGRLNVLMGGTDADVARARALIEAYAEHIHHGGDVAAGHRLKLLHNFVSLGQAVIIAEAVAAARHGGVDLGVLTDVLAGGGAGGVALDRLRPYIETGDTGAFRFAVRNAAKDLGYYTRMAEGLGARHAGADAVLAVLSDALERGGADTTMPELIDLLN